MIFFPQTVCLALGALTAGWLDRNSSLFSCLHVHLCRYFRTFRVADGGVDGFCMFPALQQL